MPRLGRDFEELVARIEQALIGSSAVVKSPDFIPDKDTGQTREVDASVRVKIGSAELLIILECRKRQKESDVRWIEQLISKRESLNSSKIIAVASKPLTKPAIQKAAKHGIDIRSVTESSVEQLRSWFKISDAHVVKYSFGYKQCYIDFVEEPKFDQKAKEQIYDYLRNFSNDRPFLRRALDGKAESLDDIWKSIPREVMERKIPPNLSYAEGEQPVYPPPGQELFIDTPFGSIQVRALRYHAFAHIVREQIPVSRAAQYADSDQALVNVFEYEIDINGKKETVTITHEIATGKVSHVGTNELVSKGVALIEGKPPCDD